MRTFKIGDKVKCLTDKYKMININDIDTVHALEANNFIRLRKSKRYKYKEIYFKLITEEEDPMATHRNPFKFIAQKPVWEELYRKLGVTYTSSMEGFKPIDIQILLFFHLSIGNWAENKKILLEPTEILRTLKQTKHNLAYQDNMHNEVLKHITGFKNPYDINLNLYALALVVGLDVGEFDYMFGVDCLGSDVESYLIANEGTPIYKIINRETLMKNFPKYVTIVPNTTSKTFVNSKNQLEDFIFSAILDGVPTIKEFALQGTADET